MGSILNRMLCMFDDTVLSVIVTFDPGSSAK